MAHVREETEKIDLTPDEEKALKKFVKNATLYLNPFDLVSKADFDENLDDMLESVLSSVEYKLQIELYTQTIHDGETYISTILNRLRETLEDQKAQFWLDAQQKNKTTRVHLDQKMAELKTHFVAQFPKKPKKIYSASVLYDEKDNVVFEFTQSFACSSALEKEDLVSRFKNDIQLILIGLQDNGGENGHEKCDVVSSHPPPKHVITTQSSLAQTQGPSPVVTKMSLPIQRSPRSVQNLGASSSSKVLFDKAHQKNGSKSSTPMSNHGAQHGGQKSRQNTSSSDDDDVSGSTKPCLSKIIKLASEHYRTAMMRHFYRPVYFNPNRLAGLHHQCARDALEKLPGGSWSPVDKSEIFGLGFNKEFEVFESRNNMNAPTSHAIGIDLGTTYSCCTVYIGGKVEIIPNKQGKLTTPSYVTFPSPKGSPIIVGDEAKAQASFYPERTVYEVKRLIGTDFDKIDAEDLDKWPFKIVKEREVAKILIDGQTYHPEEISAKILLEMKQVAEAHLKTKVQSCVITVPAYFNEGQREATKSAGQAAGLEVLRIINEPTAAAIAAYRMNWTKPPSCGGSRADPGRERKGLVFDMGGGTFDVCIYTASHDKIEICRVGGNTHLGGVDFDNEIVSYCVKEFERLHHIDLLAGKNSPDLKTKMAVSRKLMRLKGAAEQCKKQLSEAPETTIQVDCIHDQLDCVVTLSQNKFVELIEPYLKMALDCVEDLLQEANMGKSDIDEILLVGGSTRIPALRKRLRQFFGKDLNTDVDPDLSVAIGAGYEAAVLNGQRAMARGDFRLAAIAPEGLSIKDVTPMSLGIAVKGGKMFVLIPRQSKVPTECSKNFVTTYNHQTSVQIVIYEGEESLAKDNRIVGKFFLNGIPSDMAGTHSVNVTMKVSNEGIICITARCHDNGVEKELQVRDYKKRLTSKDIANIQEDLGVTASTDQPAGAGMTGKGSSACRVSVMRPCRFCREMVPPGSGGGTPVALGGTGVVCNDPDCQEYAKMSCRKMLKCGHVCGGVKGEENCLTCLRGCLDQELLKQRIDNECMICLNGLATAPAIQLVCGHVLHYHCTISLLENRWMGPRITFAFSQCPACKADIDHPLLAQLLVPIRELMKDVQEKSLLRLKHEGLDKSEDITSPEGVYFDDPLGFAMHRYSYYVCFKCTKAYFGGEAVCGDGGGGGDVDFNPAELICGGCSDVAGIQNCPKHGTDYIEFKCRYCCSPAIFFCFGNTHFCNTCHNNYGRLRAIPVNKLPKCPAGPNGVQLNGACPLNLIHPPGGQEFPLGCGLCRDLNNMKF